MAQYRLLNKLVQVTIFTYSLPFHNSMFQTALFATIFRFMYRLILSEQNFGALHAQKTFQLDKTHLPHTTPSRKKNTSNNKNSRVKMATNRARSSFGIMFVWLVGFLMSSSATRLYPGRTLRLTSENFTCCHT